MFQNKRMLPNFWLINEGNEIFDMHSKYQDHTSKNFFFFFCQNGDFKFYVFVNHKHLPTDFWRLTLAWDKVVPQIICFIKMTAKDVE